MIGRLTLDDLPAADRILAQAFNRAGMGSELRRGLALQPDGWVGVRVAGGLAGLGGSVLFPPLALIGLIAVAPEHRGRGIAREITGRLVAWSRGQGARELVLDATPAGRPLYESLGFAVIDETLTMQRDGPGESQPAAGIVPLEPSMLPGLAALDRTASGGDRSRLIAHLLREFPGRCLASRSAGGTDGYVVAQGGTIGPWIAADDGVADRLLAAALALPFDGPPRLLPPAGHAAAIAIAGRHGFAETRRLAHMRIGAPAERRRSSGLYGQLSYAFG